MKIWTIVLAAGSATRFGRAKQFERLGGIRLVDRAVETASSNCDDVVLVLPDGLPWEGAPVAAAVAGASTRSGSVRNGLRQIPDDIDVVVVHDAAHPLASRQLFASVIREVEAGSDAAVPGLPVTETIKRTDLGRVIESVRGPGLVAAQTPQAFRADVLRSAHAALPEAPDDTVLVESIGGSIVVVRGDPMNVHVTTPADLDLAARLLDARGNL